MKGDTRDVKDFEFQQLCKIRLFKPPEKILKKRASLLESSSKYGFCFAAFGKNLLVFKTLEILRVDEEKKMEKRSQTVVENFPVLKNLLFSGEITSIAVSCDDLTLLVVMETPKNVQLQFFDVRSFCLKTDCGPFLVHTVEAGIQISDLAWNPSTPELLALCLSSGVLQMLHISTDVKVENLSCNARCLCWSPKGKQVVIGTKQGELKQYSPTLELKKNWPPPNNLETQVEVLDVVWVSTYMFIAAYEPPNASDQLSIQIVNVPKDAGPSFINFQDPCFGCGRDRENKYFFHLLLKWEMVVMASSNSLEAAIISKNLDTEKNWEHWMLEDNARAEVPLTEDKNDSFPLGVSIDYSCSKQLVINDNEKIGPFPLMLILSTDGILVPFYMVYKHKAAAPLTNKANNLAVTGIKQSLPGFLVFSGPLIVPSSVLSPPTPVPPISALPTSIPTPIPTPTPQTVATAIVPPVSKTEGFPSLKFDTKPFTPVSPVNVTVSQPAKPQISGLVSVTQKPLKRTESGGQVSNSDTLSSQPVLSKQQTSINETVDSTFAKSIMEEIGHFKQELERLKLRSKSCHTIVGIEEEKKELKVKTEKILAFTKDIKKMTAVQQKEIAEQKLSLFDLFRMLEECRTKDRRNHDVRYHKLLRAQCLDPASADIMTMLHQMQQVVTNGLSDANVVLDQQWEDFQNLCNKKGRKLQPTGMDTVYQVIKKNQNIINGQKLMVKNISTQLKDMHLYKKDCWAYENIPTIKPGESELSSLADTLIAGDTRQSSEIVSPKVVAISPLKETKLREHLSKRSINIVKPENSGNESSKLQYKNISMPNLHQERPITKSSPVINRPKVHQVAEPGMLMSNFAGLKQEPIPSSFSFNTMNAGRECLALRQSISSENRTVLKTELKAPPKEGFFPMPTFSNYASGLNLEDVTPTHSISGEEDVGASVEEEEVYPDEEDEDDEDEEEYPYSLDEEEVVDAPGSKDAVHSAITSSVSDFKFTGLNSTNFSFTPGSTVPLSSNATLAHLPTTPSIKTNLFGSPSTVPSQNILGTTLTDTPKSQFETIPMSSRLGLLATPSTVSTIATTTTTSTTTTSSSLPSFAATKGIFSATPASTTSGFSFSADSSSRPVNQLSLPPSSILTSANNETQPAASLLTRGKPTNVLSSSQPVSLSEPTTSTPAPVTSLDQTIITSTATTSVISTTEVTKPNVVFSFSQRTIPTEQPSQSGSNPSFGSKLMFKLPTSTPTSVFPSAGLSPAGLFQPPQVSSEPGTPSSPAAGLFTVPSSSATGSLFKTPATASSSTCSTSTVGPAFSSLSNKPSIAAGVATPSIAAGVAAPSIVPQTAPLPEVTTASSTTSALGSLLSSSVLSKTEGLLQSLPAESSTSTSEHTTVTTATTAPASSTPAAAGLVFSPLPSTTTSNIFGQSSSTSTPSPLVTELFKPQNQSPATTSTGLFKQSTPSTVTSDLFGKMSPSSPPQGLFSQAANAGPSLFGQATVSSTSSIITGSSGATTSAFGITKNVFGAAPSGSLFGVAPSTATQPVATSTSPFGQSSISGFGQATSPSGFSKPAFGQSPFGQSSDSFKTVSAFGQSGSVSSVFGQVSSTSVFGQQSSNPGGGNIFGNASPSTTAASVAPTPTTGGSTGLFGSGSHFFSGLGSKPSQENADKNVFGSTNQVFGQTQPTVNLFGGQSGSSGFKSVSIASPKLNNSFGFGSSPGSNSGGAVSGGAAAGAASSSSTASPGRSVAASGFGVSQQQQQQGGFGCSPSFGSSPSFGGAPAFGNKPSFGFGSNSFGGNLPSFSSPFSGSSPTSVFGQNASQPAPTGNSASGFANFAQSSSPTFGSLAQTSGFGQSNNGGFGSAASSDSAFGSVPSFGSNTSSFGSGSAFGQSASFTGYRS